MTIKWARTMDDLQDNIVFIGVEFKGDPEDSTRSFWNVLGRSGRLTTARARVLAEMLISWSRAFEGEHTA